MTTLTHKQRLFFSALTKGKLFRTNVLKRAEQMGIDGAFYFGIGEMQTLTENYTFDDLNDDQQEDFISALIVKMPELEF